MKHTSDNQVSIQIKLGFHPNIISKGTKAWIKRSFRVVTWLNYKRKDIYRTIEFKWPSIEEHSFYIHSNWKFTTFPLNSKQPLVINNSHHDLDNLFYFWIFLSFLLFLFLFFFFIYTFFIFFFFCINKNNVVLIKNKNTPIYLTINSHLPFSPQLE